MISNLLQIESLAKASKFRRLRHNPGRYLFGILHRLLIYPISKKGKLVDTTTFFGTKMKVMLPSGMDLFLLGGKSHDSEIRLAKFILKSLKPGDTFIDVGAHYGYFTLLASSIVGSDGRVCSIEASSSTFNVLSQNVKNQSNIKPFNLAISDQRAQLDFYEFPLLYSEYNSLDADQYEEATWARKIETKITRIEAFSLDEFVRGEDVEPDFIKIDVEGVEDKVAMGMHQILKSNEDLTIAMEYILDNNPKSPHEKAARSIVNHGFTVHTINDAGNLVPIDVNKIQAYFLDSDLDSDNLIFKKNS